MKYGQVVKCAVTGDRLYFFTSFVPQRDGRGVRMEEIANLVYFNEVTGLFTHVTLPYVLLTKVHSL